MPIPASGKLSALVAAHETYGMKQMLSIQGSGVCKANPAGHRNQNETGLLDGWETKSGHLQL